MNDIKLVNGILTVQEIKHAICAVNQILLNLSIPDGRIGLELYEIIDLRMLSGLIGEMFVSQVVKSTNFLMKNPNIDGYPDLLDVTMVGTLEKVKSMTPADFINFEYGGLEVKNTFGVKKSNANISIRESRVAKIQNKLVWKAHHQQTNNLIALFSDYKNGTPQIVAAFFSSDITKEDWSVKQQPQAGSTMTSFCRTMPSAYKKLRDGLLFYIDDESVKEFLKI